MQAEIERELAALAGRSSCIVMRLEQSSPRELVSIAPEQRFPAASLAKVPILVEVARQIELETFRWDTPCQIPPNPYYDSAAVLGDFLPGLQPTVHDLAHLMIAVSDNAASNVLLDLVGMEAVNDTTRQLGLSHTHLERHFNDFAARSAGLDNWTTAGDMALLLSLFCTNILLPSRDVMLRMLLRQNDDSTTPAYWGEDVPYAHKTGRLPGIVHDAGILYPPYGAPATQAPLIIVLLTSEQHDIPLTCYTMARIGRIILQQAHS